MNASLTLCATTRLAQTLRGEVPAERRVWRTRQALTLAQWLGGLAEEAGLTGLADLPTALDTFADRLLWEKVIAGSLTEAAPLFDIQGMAASAAEAQALCRVWKLQPGGTSLSDEARLFVGWQAEFERRCRADGWIDTAGLHRQVIGLIEAGHFALPETVVFAGFDRFTPLERDLMAALNARGVGVEQERTAFCEEPRQAVHACADLDAECALVVAWARQRLAGNPEARLGIVAPNLAGVRDRLEFLLDDVLHPALIRPDAAEHPRCFNFSLGRALADIPLIRVALDLLSLGGSRAKIEQRRLSALLLAGGWSAAEAEADGRARLDAAVRRDLPYFTTLRAILGLAERLAAHAPSLCPETMAALAAFVEASERAPRKLPASRWAGLFRAALAAAGWPGDRPLSSHEYQARRAFGEVLDGFGRFDALLGPLGFAEAVRRLSQVCRQRLFQPETRGQPAIQVLGVLESAGLSFDALWVMGLNDDQWPPSPRPNPLLPAALLRAAGASHASAEVELNFARCVHARLSRAAPEVRYSYALADGNRLLRPSPLLAKLPVQLVEPAGLETVDRQLAATASAAIERLDDAVAPPVTDGEKVSGGSWLLRAQAICPAWAYYQYRLGGEAMEVPVEGLDPAARGTLVHAALEAFWREVQTSAALVALSGEACRQAVEAAVAAAIQTFETERRTTLPVRFRVLEAARLHKLLDVWLQLERQRSQAFAVIACEQPAEVEIDGIKVRMVVDRIDRLDDGRQLIIDYKTGAGIDTKNWAGQRITEPQLPIYAALVNDEVAAVVFAKVLLDKPAFAGVADEKDILPGVQGVGDERQRIFDPAEFPDWIAVITHWRERLHAVAGEVKAGVAGVSFADEQGLQYCEVLPLLRLPERRRLLAAAAGMMAGSDTGDPIH
ncbi:PD-(D/E)XK nuclease family protein [Dechloromonas sp. CZR5]|uniref:PD-(D/E)XK nuclease family protein n=1 Tax=Dechloromonas sp. CZR5 TaxID=2608630 RepID=UPI00123CD007|nr:PD-(D/E)XK nuclease family protein [Dechloromonas sp. CZR5]